jgi:hypothetical protein
VAKAEPTSCFKSAKELRQILDQVLRELESDPDYSSRMSAAAVPLQLQFTDLKLVLNIAADEPGGGLRWEFKRRVQTKTKPKLTLAMSSDVANRLFQGRENPAIAIARGRLRPKVEDAGAALRFFPAAKPMFAQYRELVVEKYPHLTID